MSDGYAKYCEEVERAGGLFEYRRKERERKERESRARKSDAISALTRLVRERVCEPCGRHVAGECDPYCPVAMALEKASEA